MFNYQYHKTILTTYKNNNQRTMVLLTIQVAINGLQIELYLVNGMETETMNPKDINGLHTVAIV